MRVAFDCERMKHPYTGLFEYCRQLGNALQTEKPHSADLLLYTRKESLPFFQKGISHIEQTSIHKLLFPSCKNIDIWHTTFQASAYIPGSRSLKKVLTVHDLNFLHEKESATKRGICLKKHQQNLDKVDHIVTISEFAKQDILTHLDTKGKPITVIYNGCTLKQYPDYVNPNYTSTAPFLFAIGTVNRKKNFHVLPCLLQGNNYNLVIAGTVDPQYKAQILQEARRHGVEDRVLVVGPISDEEKYWYLNNCKAFLFPSIAEGFGIPVIEAMKFGKPVFLSNKTSLPEIGGEHAYYFENFDPGHMQQVFTRGLTHYDTQHPADKILAHSSKFDWLESARAYWQVYQSLA
ncbi:MAG TPA: glycosyltransferase family 1 protein [Pontibacter sp.]